MSETARNPTTTMSWTDYRGREHVRVINHVIDIRDFKDTAAYAWLLVAANTNLSAGDLETFLSLVAEKYPKVARSRSWIQRRRWTCQPPDTVNLMNRPDRDGQDARALKIMAANPTMSLRNLVALLKKRGIRRGKDWVRRYR